MAKKVFLTRDVVDSDDGLLTPDDASKLSSIASNKLSSDLVNLLSAMQPDYAKMATMMRNLENRMYDIMALEVPSMDAGEVSAHYERLMKTMAGISDTVRRTISGKDLFTLSGLTEEERSYKRLMGSLSPESQQKLRDYVIKLMDEDRRRHARESFELLGSDIEAEEEARDI